MSKGAIQEADVACSNQPAWSEAERLAALRRYGILDTPPEPDFDAVAELASSLCGAPMAAINLIEDVRQWFKAEVGLGTREMPLDASICARVLLQPGVTVVPDLAADSRFACNPLVTGGPGLRFYAGCLLETPAGLPLGTLCVLDTVPRPKGLDERQRTALATLARQVITLLELRRAVAERDAQTAKLAAVFAQAQVGLSEIAPDGRFLAVNDRLCAMLGRSREELMTLDVQEVTHPDDLPGNLRQFARMMQTGEAFSLDKRYLRPGGEIIWANSSLTRLLDEQGRPRAALAAVVDVTARRADAARKEFILSLSDRVRALTDPRAIMAEVAEALGRHLGADCAGFSEIAPSGDHASIQRDWTRPGVPSVAGVQRLDDYDPAVVAELRAGRTVRVADVTATPLTAGGKLASAYTRIRAQAFLGVPLVEDGRLAAVLFVLREQPCRWSDDDAKLVEEVAERVRNAVERVRAEAALRRSERELGLALKAGRFGAWTLDLVTGELVSSAMCRANFGRDPHAEFTYPELLDAVHPDDRERMVAAVEHSVATGADYDIEYRAVTPSGDVRWIGIRGQPAYTADGSPLRMSGVSVDVTERKAAEERLREGEMRLREANETLEARVAERTAELSRALGQLHEEVVERERAEEALRQSQKMEAVGQLTGGIAHDFNNMLQSIAGSLELMRRRTAQGRTAEAERFVETAVQAVDRAAELTHRLLAFARRQTLQPKPVDPDALIGTMAELIRRAVGPQVNVRTRVADGIWSVLCDANQLENALLNLAVNARDAMPGGGTLLIAASAARLDAADVAGNEGMAPGGYVEISVTDTGTGMTRDVLERAFEPFFTTKPVGQGTGLGLSQLYGFVRQSGGLVRLESEPGQGTTVRLYLPRHDAAVSRDARADGADGLDRAEMTGGTVLVVEDEDSGRALLAEALRELGCKVLEASDSSAGLRVLQSREHVDLLLTDVGLPGLNGRQLADAARERRPRLPVLLVTGYAGAALDHGQLAPGMEVLRKPFTMQALAARVATLLRERPDASAA